jgi:hypothetical protein
MGYKNFKLAIYCPVGSLNNITDLHQFEEQFRFIERHLRPDKVYLETFRDFHTIDREKMLSIKEFFQKKGIQTSGGITTSAWSTSGFGSFCYTNEDHKNKLREMAIETASLFDEIILDDFYFTNCKCNSCIEQKGERSWAEFRCDMMNKISREYVINPAKQANPAVSLIIKFPNWYEHYQETGYNLKDEPELFDMIYTGTETRDPQYTHQHLPRYLSYFLMRYLENIKPGKNGGGWFDPFQCSYNPASYADQGYLTLLGKAKEVTLFSLGNLINRDYSLFVPIAGYVLDSTDEFLGELGAPTGTSAYIPYHSSGEDHLHNYMGMLGIPLDPFPSFPFGKDVFLTQSAACDGSILEKIQDALVHGQNVVITSGLLEKLQDKGFGNLANIRVTDRKVLTQHFGISHDGVIIDKTAFSDKPVMLPQVEYCTNDVWQLACAFGNENNFPVLLKATYGNGSLFVLTIPDDFGDLYHYPREVLNSIRRAIGQQNAVKIDAPANIGLFTYDNNTFVIKSFLPYQQEVTITIPKKGAGLVDVVSGVTLKGLSMDEKTVFSVDLLPMSHRVYKIL